MNQSIEHPAASAALATSREKLAYLQEQLAITVDPAAKFTIGKQIEELAATTDHRAFLREGIRKRLDQLAREYLAALQRDTSDDPQVRAQARQAVQDIHQRIQELEAELARLDPARAQPHADCSDGHDPRHEHDRLAACIHEIDYKPVDAWVRRFMDADGDAGRAALLMFRRCLEMNGALCAARIREILRAKTAPGLFSHRRVELQSAVANDTAAVLHRLGGQVGLSLADLAGRTPGQQLRQVVGRLCESLQTGSILLLEIAGCDCLIRQDHRDFHWVVVDFWRQLLDALRPVAAELDGSVTVVAVVFFDGDPPDGSLPAGLCCCEDDFHPGRILEIPLRHWTIREVRDWLNTKGLPGYSPADQRALLDDVMNVTAGIPDRTANELLKRCAAIVSQRGYPRTAP